jgi:hypothetical protein
VSGYLTKVIAGQSEPFSAKQSNLSHRLGNAFVPTGKIRDRQS